MAQTASKRPFQRVQEGGTPNCRNFEPVVTAYVEVFARPEPYLVALDRLVKQRA